HCCHGSRVVRARTASSCSPGAGGSAAPPVPGSTSLSLPPVVLSTGGREESNRRARENPSVAGLGSDQGFCNPIPSVAGLGFAPIPSVAGLGSDQGFCNPIPSVAG